MSSPSHVLLESTPSYIQELNEQFAAQPLPNFQLMDEPVGELSYPSEPPSPPTPPLMQVKCETHPSLLQRIEQEIANTPVNDTHPGCYTPKSHFSFLWTAPFVMSSPLPHHSAYYPLLTPFLTIYKA